MNVTYDPRTDTLLFELKPGPIVDSDQHAPGIVFDYDEAGRIVSIEILDASRNVADVRNLRFEIVTE